MRGLLTLVGGMNLVVALTYFHDGQGMHGVASLAIALGCVVASIAYEGRK